MLNLIQKIYRLLFGRKVFYKFNRFIYSLSIRGMGILNYENHKISGEQSFLKEYISNLHNGIVFDVGANLGNYSKYVRKLNQNVDIYAFEPHPITFKKLEEAIVGYNIKILNVAIGSKTGKCNLYDYFNQDGFLSCINL
ncbi:MAG: FkbM family methyltransferase [Brevinematia bacterium]